MEMNSKRTELFGFIEPVQENNNRSDIVNYKGKHFRIINYTDNFQEIVEIGVALQKKKE